MFLYLFICLCIFSYIIIYFFMYSLLCILFTHVSTCLCLFLFVCEFIYFGDHDTDEALLDCVEGLELNSDRTSSLVHIVSNCDCISVYLFRMTTIQM
jgi:hypothetical protein